MRPEQAHFWSDCFHQISILLLILTLGMPAILHAQVDTAALLGSVSDPSSAVVPGAQIIITDEATHVARTLQTDRDGSFAINGIKPATYTISVEMAGFKTYRARGIRLNVGDRKSLSIRLALGEATEVVNVSGSDVSLVTTDAGVSTVVDKEFVQNIPLNGRSFQDLILLAPGTTSASPQNPGSSRGNGSFTVNGQGSESNVFQIDGVSANVGAGNAGGYSEKGNGGALPASTALGTTQSIVSVDSLQEFRVSTSSYSAEYGRGAGGQISFASASGDNKYHGSLFDYLRNNVLDANDYFNKFYQPTTPRQPLRQNDFGGTVSGPVWIPKVYNGHNKTFFFFNYEGLRLQQPTAASTSYVPNAAMRSAAPAGSIISQLLNSFPKANGPSVMGNESTPDLAAYVSGYSSPSALDTESFRIDQVIGNKSRLFYRFSNTTSFSDQGYVAALYSTAQDTRTHVIGLTTALSSKMTNEFRANYSSNSGTQRGSLQPQNGGQPFDLASASGVPSNAASWAATVQLGYSDGSIKINDYNGVNINRQVNFADSLEWLKGRHQLKVGVDYKRLTSTDLTESPAFFYEFYDPADTIANNIGYAQVAAQKPFFPLFQFFASYIQDEWQATKKLTISAGLRWDIDPAGTSRRGPLPLTLQGQDNLATATFAPVGTSIYPTSYRNFAPRLGLSYLAHNTPGHETVIRAGGGLYFDPVTNQADTLSGYEGPGYNSTVSYCAYSYCNMVGNYGFPLPVSARNPPITFPPTLPATGTVYAFSPTLKTPRSVEYNLALQQSLSSKTVLTFTFVGSESRDYIGGQTKYVGSINPNFTNINVNSNQLSSTYHSGQITFQQQFVHGIYAYAGYAWSHGISSLQVNSYTPYQRANQATDLRHNFNAAMAWKIPGNKHDFFTRGLTSDWELDPLLTLHTGFPLELYGPYESGSAFAGTSQETGLNLVAATPIFLNGKQYPGGRSLNKAAFTAAPIGVVGTAPQNYYRGFGEAAFNLALQRSAHIHDRLALLFRFEAFNVLNRANFGSVDTGYSDALFGQATSSLSTALGSGGAQSPLYASGGPRSMQVALKLTF